MNIEYLRGRAAALDTSPERRDPARSKTALSFFTLVYPLMVFALCQAFAMLELATSQFRDKSSEAHKKCAGTIRELIANSLTAARKTLAASAMGTKKMAAEETWCVLDAELKKTAQAGGHLDVSDPPSLLVIRDIDSG